MWVVGDIHRMVRGRGGFRVYRGGVEEEDRGEEVGAG